MRWCEMHVGNTCVPLTQFVRYRMSFRDAPSCWVTCFYVMLCWHKWKVSQVELQLHPSWCGEKQYNRDTVINPSNFVDSLHTCPSVPLISSESTFQYPPLAGPMRFMTPFCWSIFRLYFTPSSDNEPKFDEISLRPAYGWSSKKSIIPFWTGVISMSCFWVVSG